MPKPRSRLLPLATFLALACLLGLGAWLRRGPDAVQGGEAARALEREAGALAVEPVERPAAPAPAPLSQAAVRDAAAREVRLAGRGRLRGAVLVRESGEGLAGARVELLALPPIGVEFVGRVLRLARLGDGFAQRARPLAVTHTDPLGQFEFEGVRQGRFYVDVASEYHLMEAPVRVGVYASGEGGPIDVWVREGGVVRGEVLDAEGRAVPRAEVVLVPGPNLFLSIAREGALRLLEVEADAQGRFAFGGVAPGRGYDLTAVGRGIAISHTTDVDVVAGQETRVVVRAREGGTVAGRVFSAEVDPSGEARARRPLEGAHVGAVPRGMRDLRFVEEILADTHAVTDEEGRYLMRRVPPGDTDIVAYAPDHVLGAGTLVLVRDGERCSAGPIVLETGETLRGRVVDGADQPVEGVHVIWSTFDFRSMQRRGMDLSFAPFLSQAVEGFAFPYTDAEGRFEAGPFPDDPPHRLRFYKEGFREVELELDLSEDEQVVVLERGGAIEGVVMDRDAAAPVTNFAIRTMDRIETRADAPGRFNPFSVGEVFDDPSGRFRLDSVRAGEVEFTVSAPGYSPRTVSGVEVVEGETKRGLIVTLRRGGVVRGVVTDGEGEPVAGATVMVLEADAELGKEFRRPSDPSRLPQYLPKAAEVLPPAVLGYAAGLGLFADEAARTASDGSFEVGGLAPGPRLAVALHPDFAPTASEEFELPEGEVVEGLELELTSGATVFGSVRDRNGAPVARTMVVAVSPSRFASSRAESAGGGFYQTQTDQEGAYELEHLAAGSYFLVSTRGDAALNPLSFFATLDFDLVNVPAGQRVRYDIVDESLGGTRVHGRVLDDGAPVGLLHLNALGWEAENALGVDWKVARVDAEGRYEFEGLAPGEYQFQVDGLDQRVRIAVEIPDQAEYALDLELPGGIVAGRLVDDASGEPVSGARVYLRPTDEVQADGLVASLLRKGGTVFRERTDRRGAFAFERLGAGEFELSVQLARAGDEVGLAPPEPLILTLGRDERRDDLELRLARAASLEGVVLDAERRPVGGARVLARPRGSGGMRPARATSDQEGHFELTGIGAGEYSLQATADGFAGVREESVRVSGEPNEPLELVLERGVRVRVEVVGPDGSPLAGAGARLERTDAAGFEVPDPNGAVRRLFSGQGTTDEEGELVLGRFVQGTYELSVWRGLSRHKQPGVEVGDGEGELRLRVTLE